MVRLEGREMEKSAYAALAAKLDAVEAEVTAYIAAHNERIAAARLVLAEKTDRNYGYLLALYA
jgi:hypothetical protein